MATGIIQNAQSTIDPATGATLPNDPTKNVDSQLSVTQNGNSTTAQAAPTSWNVDPATQTTSGQLSKVLDPNSDLMQQAQTQAKQASAASGLLNSSMAATAGQDAMLRAAVPIANANAATYADAAKTNAGTANAFAQQTNQQANTLQKTAVDQANTQANLATQQQYTQQNMQTQQANNLQTLSTQYGFDLGKMDAQTRQTLTTMTADQQNTLAKMAANQGYNLQTMSAQQVNDLQKMNVQQQNNLQTLSTQYGFDLGKMDVQAKNTLQQMSVQQQNDMAKLAQQQGYNVANMNQQQINDLAKLNTQINGQTSIANIEAQYKNVTQGSQSATNVMTNAQNNIQKILADTNITGAAKADAIAQVQQNVEESMKLIGSLAGNIDLSGIVKP